MSETDNDQNHDPPEPKRSQQALMIQHVSVPGIILIAIYLVVVSLFLLYGIVRLWPSAESSRVYSLLGIDVTDEVQLILIVVLAGALGGMVHALRSFFWYVGNRGFVRSWIFMYLMIPFVGSSLSLLFYFVLRGGLFSPEASFGDTSPFGFTAVAGLVGMFSNQAAQKLKEVAESLFATREPIRGADHISEEEASESNGA